MVYINTTGKHNEVWLDKPYATITVECPECPSTEDAYSSGYTDGSEEGYHKGYPSGYTDGYDSGYTDGQESVDCEDFYNSGYTSGYTDGADSVDCSDFYNSGVTDGIAEQKSKLVSTAITENGTYSREDGGFSQVEVNVPTGQTINNQNISRDILASDLMYAAGHYMGNQTITHLPYYTGIEKVDLFIDINASEAIELGYDSGYTSGYTDGVNSVVCSGYTQEDLDNNWNSGYTSGYTDGINACSGGNEGLIANLQGDYYVIPEGTTHLRDYAFYFTCFSSITIPDTVVAIGSYAFAYNECLTSITIPDSVQSLGASAFYRCTNLQTAILGSGLTKLESYTFSNCTSLTGITIPSGISQIGKFSFANCSGLTEMTFEGLNPPTINTGTSLGLTDYTFPIYVPCQSLDAYKTAFGEYYAPRIMCNSGTSGVSILDFVYETSAANQTIRLFTGEAQNDNAFFDEFYSAITRMDIDGVQAPKSENNIYRTYPRSADWYFYTFPTAGRHTVKFYISREYNAGWTLDKLIFAYSPGYDGSHPEYPDAMPPCPIVEANIGETYEWLSQGVFQNAYELTAVTLPNSLKWVGPYSFEYSGIKEITIPDSVTQIRYESFYGTDGLFNSCSALTSATIGSGITDLKNYTFNNCTSLETVTMKPTTPPVIGNNTFNNCTSLAHIYVPEEAVEDYKAATGWSNYASIISAIQ